MTEPKPRGAIVLRALWLAVALVLLSLPAAALEPASAVAGPAVDLARALPDGPERQLAFDLLAHNPEVAAAVERAQAAESAAPVAAALPDPTATVTAYVSTPETRVGPQRALATLSQRLPWLSRLTLRERAAALEAAALAADAEALALARLTELRVAWHELRFVDQRVEILRDKRHHMLQHEELARARYASGSGSSRDAVKMQAEITRVEQELLGWAAVRAGLEATLAELRGLPGEVVPSPPVGAGDPAAPPPESWEVADLAALSELAAARRPEVAAARLRIAVAETGVEVAESWSKPDFTVGLTYTLVDPREDTAGRAAPPAGNGGDVFGIVGGVSIPLWRRPRLAEVEAAVTGRRAGEQQLAARRAAVVRQVSAQLARLPLDRRQVELLADVLIPQAEEALRSAENGYSTGTAPALALLDAEHVLFDAYVAEARARADLAITRARLDGAMATPSVTIPPDPMPAADPGGSR